MNSLGVTVFWCVAQVTVLTLVAGLLYFVVRRLSPAAGAFVALASLLLVTVITALSVSPWPNWLAMIEKNRRQPSLLAADGTRTEGLSPSGQHPEVPMSSLTFPPATESPLAAAARAFWDEVRNPRAEAGQARPWNWAGLISLFVLTGAAIGTVRLVMGLISVRQYRRESEPIQDSPLRELVDILAAQMGFTRPVEVRENRRVAGAATIGWLHPLILLPPSWRHWSESDRRAVLAHELAHVYRGDYLTWLAAQIGLALHFYHPLAHWLCRCLRMDQELLADSAAARLVGGHQTYLQSLAKIALQQSDTSLSWPARTFLPTRRTFLRRIEMLRNSKDNRLTPAPKFARWSTAIILLATGLGVVGLRGSAGLGDGVAQAQPPALPNASGRQGGEAPLGLTFVPRDAVAVVGLRPAAILRRPAMQPVAGVIQKLGDLEQELGVAAAQVERLQIFMLAPVAERKSPQVAALIRLTTPDAARQLATHLAPRATKEVYGTQEYFRQEPDRYYFLPDGHTVVFSPDDGVLHRSMVAGLTGASTANWAGSWARVASSDMAALVNTAALRGVLSRSMAQAPDAVQIKLAAYSPLWEKTEVAAAGILIGDSLKLQASITSNNADDARRVHDTLAATKTLAQNTLNQARQSAANSPSPDAPLLSGALDVANELLEVLKIGQSDSQVTLDLQTSSADAIRLVSTLLPAVTAARDAARRQQSANNLKQIALALHNFHDRNQRFPPAVVLGPNNVPRSWRIEILPYLNANDLYEQYHKEEPWDSEHNKSLLAKMPPVFRNPMDDPHSTNTSYFVIAGPGTIFDGAEGTQILQIRDGTSNTLLAVEAKRDVPWTKPDDIPYAADKPLPKFGGWNRGGYFAALADGSVRFLSESLDQNVLRLLITKADDTPVNF
jgi:beta-lactamase regulating signal transducer with metallopeptidase domain